MKKIILALSAVILCFGADDKDLEKEYKKAFREAEPQKTLKVAQKYCELNVTRACSDLSDGLWDELDGKKASQKDYQKVIFYLQKACELKDSTCCYELGVLYKNGTRNYINAVLKAPKDEQKSQEFFKKACSLGEILACDAVK